MSRKQKGPPEAGGPFLTVNSLALTYFRSIYLELSSAQLRFTVLFGMGRRGSKALWAPDVTCSPYEVSRAGESGRRNIEWGWNCIGATDYCKVIGSSLTGN